MSATDFTPEQIAAYRADPTTAPRWMRGELASLVFGASVRTLRRQAAAGLVRVARPGARITLYDRDSILALLASTANRAEVAPPQK